MRDGGLSDGVFVVLCRPAQREGTLVCVGKEGGWDEGIYKGEGSVQGKSGSGG